MTINFFVRADGPMLLEGFGIVSESFFETLEI